MTNISSIGSGDLLPQEEKLEEEAVKTLFIGVQKKLHFKKVEYQ